MADPKWSDDGFLDGIGRQADPLADDAVARIFREHGLETVNRIFKSMYAHEEPLPDDAPPAFREFVEQTSELPAGIDHERLQKGGEVFFQHAFSAAVVLLASSLPAGYSAPRLSRILTVSGDLQKHPYERLMGVVQLLVNISSPGSFDERGRAVLMAQKMRLLHGGIRTIVPKYRPDYLSDFGTPVSHEDMLATIMGFSYLVIDGLRIMKVGLRPDEEENYYYLWRVFAQMVGIHPAGEPDNDELVPATVDDAAAFYASYCRRHYRPAADNPDGVTLSRVNLELMRHLIPWPLRLLGLRALPRIVMMELLGEEGMARTGIAPITGHPLLRGLFALVLRLVQGAMDDGPSHVAERLGHLVLQDMIDKSRDGEVTFLVPASLADMRKLA